MFDGLELELLALDRYMPRNFADSISVYAYALLRYVDMQVQGIKSIKFKFGRLEEIRDRNRVCNNVAAPKSVSLIASRTRATSLLSPTGDTSRDVVLSIVSASSKKREKERKKGREKKRAPINTRPVFIIVFFCDTTPGKTRISRGAQ